VCGKTCQNNYTCQKGLCALNCLTPFTACAQSCTDISKDASNCGACGNVCKSGEQCVKGVCTLECTSGLTRCGTSCVDAQRNNKHCGACNKACATNESCQNGQCKLKCPLGYLECSGACVDPQLNPKHCGACDKACSNGTVCSGGSCNVFCGSGTKKCDAICANTSRDPRHCGDCNITCQNEEVCIQGTCQPSCPSGYLTCKGLCVNINTSRYDCGACGTTCNDQQTCSAGTCVACLNCPLWLASFTGQSFEEGRAIHSDDTGNIYSVGTFRGNSQLGLRVLRAKGTQDLYISKFDTNGNILWAQSASSVGFTEANDVTTDTAYNVYAIGSFEGTGTFGQTSLTVKGGSDVVITKIDKNGVWQWAKAFGGKDNDTGISIAIDAQDNLYVAGTFRGSMTLGQTTLTATGDADIFLASLDSKGQWRWATSFGGTLDERVTQIALDSQGNIYVSGQFLGLIKVNNASFGSKGMTDAFLAKFDNTGTYVWLQTIGGKLSDKGRSVVVDSKDNVYMAGEFQDLASSSNSSLTSLGARDAFVGKWTSTGALLWLQSMGGAGIDTIERLSLSPNDQLYASGSFQGSAQFGTTIRKALGGESDQDLFMMEINPQGFPKTTVRFGSQAKESSSQIHIDTKGAIIFQGLLYDAALFGKTTFTFGGRSDTFLTKYRSLPCPDDQRNCGNGCVDVQENKTHCGACNTTCTGGQICAIGQCSVCSNCPSWVKALGGLANEKIWQSTVDSKGNIYIIGQFEKSLQVDNTVLHASGASDIFVLKLDKDGALIWATKAGGTAQDVGQTLALDAQDNLFIAGYYSATARFGNNTQTSKGGVDVFVAALDADGKFKWVKSAGGAAADFTTSLDVNNSFVALTGYFYGTASFGTTTYKSKGNHDSFITLLDKQGAWKSTAVIEGTESIASWKIRLDTQSNIFVSGYYAGTATFGSKNHSAKKEGDIFITKLDKSGTFKWSLSAGGDGFDYGRGFALDNTGAIYLTGYFHGEAAFGTKTIKSKGSADVFVAKVSVNGQWEWVSGGGGVLFDAAYDLQLGPHGDIYITGEFRGNATFETLPLLSKGGSDIFLLHVNTKGRFLRALQAGGASIDEGSALSIDQNGHFLISGNFFSTPANFGLFRRSARGNSDIFVSKYTTLPCAAPFKDCGGRCVDPNTSDEHCGTCNNKCTQNKTCTTGTCQ